MKDKQFVKLQSKVKDEDIAVIRGKYGATQSVNIYQLVVGDIILLETGSRVPADCILVEGADVSADESPDRQGEDENIKIVAIKKTVATEDTIIDSPDPFLIADSRIVSGSGKAVVCCVGAKSTRGL